MMEEPFFMRDQFSLVKFSESAVEREAALYGDTYKLIEIIVARICKARDVGVVIRFTSKSFDPHDRTAVLQTLNRFVIYTAGPDLTDEIVAELNR
jgi:hypothetical protein